MLGIFREKIVKFGAQLLFVLLILSFVAWGVGDYIGYRGRSANQSVAEVGGRSISARDFQREMQDQIGRMRQMFGDSFNAEQARAMGIDDSVLQSMIQDMLFSEGARKLGLVVDDAVVSQEIRRDPTFQTAGGGFDRLQFETAQRQANFSEAQYVALMRSDILRQQYLSPILLARAAPQTLVDSLYKYRNEKRIAQIITLPHAAITNIPAPTDDELAAYHQKNSAAYTSQETRAITIVRMRPEDVVDEIDVADADIEKAYNDNIDQFSTPERRTITQALFPDEASARAAMERAAKGEDFAKIAQASGGGPLGTMSKAEVPIPELADAAFAILPETVSAPIESPLGWHLVRVSKIEAATQRPLTEVRNDIRKDIALDKAADVLVRLASKFEDELGGGATAEQAAQRLKLNTLKIDSIDREGRDAAGNRYNDITPEMLRGAFDTTDGKDSALGDLREGGHYLIHVDKVFPASLRPLDEIKDRVRTDWQAAQRAERAEAVVKVMLDEIKGGKILADVAASHGAKLSVTQPFTRTRTGLDVPLPGSLISALFKSAPGTPESAPAEDSHVIGIVSQIVTPDPAVDAEATDRLKDELSGALVNDLSTSLAGALREKMPVSIDRAAVDSAL